MSSFLYGRFNLDVVASVDGYARSVPLMGGKEALTAKTDGWLLQLHFAIFVVRRYQRWEDGARSITTTASPNNAKVAPSSEKAFLFIRTGQGPATITGP